MAMVTALTTTAAPPVAVTTAVTLPVTSTIPLVKAPFSYDYQASANSTVLKVINDAILPWQCHEACTKASECKGWQFQYATFLRDDLKAPDCNLFSSVEWIKPGDKVKERLATIVGALNDSPFDAPPEKPETCSPEVCQRLTAQIPNFTGPWSKYGFFSSCDASNPYCLMFPSLSDPASRSGCCTVCGTSGAVPCDRSPIFTAPREHGIVASMLDRVENAWKEKESEFLLLGHNGWGCWSQRHLLKNPTTLTSSLVDSTNECMETCRNNAECVAWQWISNITTPAFQKCELFSEVEGIEKLEVKIPEMMSAVGLKECLSPLAYGTSEFLEFVSTISMSSDDQSVEDLLVQLGIDASAEDPGKTGGILSGILDLIGIGGGNSGSGDPPAFAPPLSSGPGTSASPEIFTATQKILKDLRKMLNPLSEAAVMVDLSGVVNEFSPYSGSAMSLATSIIGKLHDQKVQFFETPKSEIEKMLQAWILASSLTFPIDMPNTDFDPVGLAVQCGGILSNDRCVLACPEIPGSVAAVTGMIEINLGYEYDLFNSKIIGPGMSDILMVEGICDVLKDKFSTTTTPTPGASTTPNSPPSTTPPPRTCLSSGHLSTATDAVRLNEDPSADTAILCDSSCAQEPMCKHFNFTGKTCELMQNGATLDKYFVEDEPRCESDCQNDSECHAYKFHQPKCELFNAELTAMKSVGCALDAVTGPSTECGYESMALRPVAPLSAPVQYLNHEVNPINLMSQVLDTMKPGECSNGFHMAGGECVKIFWDRVSRQDARRICSDNGATLWTPNTAAMDELCSHGHGDCYSTSTRNAQLWTNLTPEEVNPMELGPRNMNELDDCVFADLSTSTLIPTTCGAYCVTPASALSTSANAEHCGQADGRYAIKRHPFACTANKPKADVPPKAIATNHVEYTDGEGIKRCAMKNVNIKDNDMWSTVAWAEPLNTWNQCEGLCRAIGGCEGWTYVPPHCTFTKEESDKGWEPSLILTEMTSSNIDGRAADVRNENECKIRCQSNPECNIASEYVPGVCYLKNRNNAEDRVQVKSWMEPVSGPTECSAAATDHSGSADCPSGYELYEEGGEGICVMIGFETTTGIEANQRCLKSGGMLASPKTEKQNKALLKAFCSKGEGGAQGSCEVPRGDGALDGVFFFGLNADRPWLHNEWKWADGSLLTYGHKFGGQPGTGNPPLIFNNWPTIQPDNTSLNQLCTYFYPQDSPTSRINGFWGDEDCDTKCLQPASSYQVMTSAPLCNHGLGRITSLGRRYVCTAEPGQ